MSASFDFPSAEHLRIMFTEATPVLLAAKAVGAVAGSLISIAYVLPRGRREAMLRLTVGIVTGLVFGSTAGIRIAGSLGVLERISIFEVTLMGATFASLSAWWALGVLRRVAERAIPGRLAGGLSKSLRHVTSPPENEKDKNK